jgi:uncharacterized membrane protein YccC
LSSGKLAGLVRDPDRTVLHRAIRAALVLPALLWVGLHVLHDMQFALVASFGSFAAIGMADFTGPRRSRLLSHLVLAMAGAVLVAAGTALSGTLWPAVIVMLVVGVGAQFLMALGGQFALGNNAGVLAFVVAVMVPAGNEAIASRVAGWLVALACSAAVSSLLWPRHERRDLYASVAAACRALSAVAGKAAAGGNAEAELAAMQAAVAKVRENQRALGFRQIGPPEHQRALLGLVDSLAQAARFARVAVARPLTEADRDLARAIAGTFDFVAGVMSACAAGRPHFPEASLEMLAGARHEHLAKLDAAARRALDGGAAGASVVAAFSDVFAVRVLSFITLSMAVDALVISGRPVRVHDDFSVIEPAAAQGAWRHAVDTLGPHFVMHSVWLRNSLRAGLALALSVLVAKATDIAHAFWVVLATLAVLRSNVATTGATVVSAVVGTFAGFVLATLAILVLGSHPVLMWMTLPFAVLIAVYAPTAISFGAGQAMFALLVVELFNLITPEGWVVGVDRVEAVFVGALVAFAASLIMWPKGAGAVLRTEIAAHVRSATRLVRAGLGLLIGRTDPRTVEGCRAEVNAVRHRADEAFASFIGERGAKRIPIDEWAWLARVPLVMRGAAEAALSMQRAGLVVSDGGEAAEVFAATAATVEAAYDELAARLADPAVAKDPASQSALAELDMMHAGAGRRDALLAAVATYTEAHRAEPDVVARTMALAFGAGWLAYLAHVRITAEPALDDVVAHADVAWWR